MNRLTTILGGIFVMVLTGSLFAQHAIAPRKFEEVGYPRMFEFRSNSPERLRYMNRATMVVSDTRVRIRRGSESEFKKKFPSRPVLVQINFEDLHLWGTWIFLPKQRLEDVGMWRPEVLEHFPELTENLYPIADFAGYWVYEAGADTTDVIPAEAENVTVGVTDIEPFLPNENRFDKSTIGRTGVPKDIVICPRDGEGNLDWLRAEFASITSIDEEAKTVTFRRWRTGNSWARHPNGTYLAPNANQIVLRGYPKWLVDAAGLRDDEFITPFLPNLTRFCPRDPRTGLNAAEWLARHFIEAKKRHYPILDGYVFDVSAGMFHPSWRMSERIDCDLDGEPEFFYFDNIDHWALGMYDFFAYLRDGVEDKFDGLGDDLVIVSDANINEEQRFFDLINGAEVEHSMIHPAKPHTYSSAIDRYLLWCSRAREPRVSYIHNKYPTDTYHGGTDEDLKFYMHDNYYRLDIASACMGLGYVGKAVARPKESPAVAWPGKLEQIEKYGFALPYDWDEYHSGTDNVWNWLGMPVEDPVRVTDHLKKELVSFGKESPLPALEADEGYEARPPVRTGDRAVTVDVTRIKPWRNTSFKIRLAFQVAGLKKGQEYAVRFNVRAPSPYGKIDPKYRTIPRNVQVRLCVGKDRGKSQEALVFAEKRECFLTVTAPASGDGRLELGLAEEPGEITISDLDLFEGCADIFCRKFENGLVLLNGSATAPHEFDFNTLFPDEPYSHIPGAQDPKHNSGKPVGATLMLGPRDGILLKKTD